MGEKSVDITALLVVMFSNRSTRKIAKHTSDASNVLQLTKGKETPTIKSVFTMEGWFKHPL